MKKQFTGFIAGVLTTTLLLGLSITALAVNGQVSFNTINLTFNGEVISKSGENYALENGSQVPASIIYTDEQGGGTTYLPVRRISELLEVNIGWDNGSKSVVLGEENTPPTPTTKPTDPSHIPDITLAEIKEMFEFKCIGDVGGRDKYYYGYSGDKPFEEFWAYWQSLNKEDINFALEQWILEISTQEGQTAERDISLSLSCKTKEGTTMSCGHVMYGITKGIYH